MDRDMGMCCKLSLTLLICASLSFFFSIIRFFFFKNAGKCTKVTLKDLLQCSCEFLFIEA